MGLHFKKCNGTKPKQKKMTEKERNSFIIDIFASSSCLHNVNKLENVPKFSPEYFLCLLNTTPPPFNIISEFVDDFYVNCLQYTMANNNGKYAGYNYKSIYYFQLKLFAN